MLAIGLAIAACLASGAGRAAEADDDASAAVPRQLLLETLGMPKPVRTVPVGNPRAETAPAARAAMPKARYSGDDEYRRCIDQVDGTNVTLSQCGGALIAREDRRLNEAWKRVYADGAETKSQELLDEQRVWLAFRDASCTVYRSGRLGREGQVLSYPVCRAGVIAERTAALDAYAEPGPR